MVPQNFKQKFVDAAIHLVNAILKILLYPFTFWINALTRLADQKKPIYDPSVLLNLDLLYDGLAFLSYPLGVLGLIVSFFAVEIYKLPFGDMVVKLLGILLVIYVLPVVAWLANIATRYAIKLAIQVVKILWTAIKGLILKFYNFIANPQWHFAIKHIHKQEKSEE